MPRHLRIFVSSPGDLAEERSLLPAVIERIGRRPAWKGKFSFETLSWDDVAAPVPMDARLTPQQAVDRGLGLPSACDLVIVLFWSRMGTPLAEPLKADGARWLSGTEYQFDEATASASSPPVLLYRRVDEPVYDAEPAIAAEQRRQSGLVQTFFESRRPAHTVYRGAAEFADRFALDLESLLRRFDETDVGGPPLELKTYAVETRSWLHFRARGAPLVGREQVWQSLREFVVSSTPFAWWSVGGKGGAGKSRIALELALSLRSDGWRAGFLPLDHGFDDWRGWRPDRPTLIVVDYLLPRIDEVRRLLAAFADRERALPNPVRVLLLERETDADAPLWKQLFGTGSTALALRASRHDGPINLGPLADDALWRIVEQVTAQAGTVPERDDVIRSLHEIDPAGTPLFALLAADALGRGKSLREWNRERLLDDFLAREEAHFWRPAGAGERELHLLALATMTRGFPVRMLRELPALEDLLPGTTPGPARFDSARYAALTGRPSGSELAPLKPDLVGEYFVLRLLARRDDLDDRAEATVARGGPDQPDGCVQFSRAVLDRLPGASDAASPGRDRRRQPRPAPSVSDGHALSPIGAG